MAMIQNCDLGLPPVSICVQHCRHMQCWLRTSNTNTQIQIHEHKYTNTNTQTQIHKHKYTNTGGRRDGKTSSSGPRQAWQGDEDEVNQ